MLLAQEPRRGNDMAKSKYTKEEYAEVIDSGRLNEIKKHIGVLQKALQEGETDPVSVNELTGECFTALELLTLYTHPVKEVDVCLKLIRHESKKTSYYKKNIKNWFDKKGNLFFVTLNTNNELTSMKSEDMIKGEVYRYLDTYKINFLVGTMGIGEINKRLHFHIVVDKEVDLKKWPYGKYGKIEEVKKNSWDVRKLSCYLSKNFIESKSDTSIVNRSFYLRDKTLLLCNTYPPITSKFIKKQAISYNVNNAISSINKSKSYPIYMDNVL
jgi:hypothetical protein